MWNYQWSATVVTSLVELATKLKQVHFQMLAISAVSSLLARWTIFLCSQLRLILKGNWGGTEVFFTASAPPAGGTGNCSFSQKFCNLMWVTSVFGAWSSHGSVFSGCLCRCRVKAEWINNPRTQMRWVPIIMHFSLGGQDGSLSPRTATHRWRSGE